MIKTVVLAIFVACFVSLVWAQNAAPISHKIAQGPNTIFQETFDDASWTSRWVSSSNPEYTGTWEVSEGIDEYATKGDSGLTLLDVARKHAISAKFDKPYDFKGKNLIIQYEVRTQKGMECGGAYLKLLAHDEAKPFNSAEFDNTSPYVIMFGPDKCGAEGKCHFIFNHKDLKSGKIEEKHMHPILTNHFLGDSLTHLYRLEINNAENTFALWVDSANVRNGSFFEDFVPPVNPPLEIDDPTDIKPADWVDEEMMDDPEDIKPEGYDDILKEIPDPEATKPADWDDELDGEWEAPTILNPEYQGPWTPHRIPNPAYKGVWKPRQIPNPNYYEDKHPADFYTSVAGIGFELWTMQSHYWFNNIILTTDSSEADELAELWEQKHVKELEILAKEEEKNGPSIIERFIQNAKTFAVENPITFAASALAGLIPVFIWFILRRGSESAAPVQQDAPATETKEEPKVAKQKEETPKEQAKQRKRKDD